MTRAALLVVLAACELRPPPKLEPVAPAVADRAVTVRAVVSPEVTLQFLLQHTARLDA